MSLSTFAHGTLHSCKLLMAASVVTLAVLVGAVSAMPVFDTPNTHLPPERLAEIEALMDAR